MSRRRLRAALGYSPPVGAVLVVLMLVASTVMTTASAQPYAASGGFGRPAVVAGPGVVGTVATASHHGVVQVVWADANGVWRRPLADAQAEPVQMVPAGSIRGVSATTAGGDIAVAWLERDLRTGRTKHSLTWRSQVYVLFETNLEVPLLAGAAGGAPWVLAAPRADGRAHLTLFRVSPQGVAEEPVRLYSTTLNVTGVRATGSDDALRGPAFIAWLEGHTASTALGNDSEWDAYVLRPARDAAPLALGAADVTDQRQAVAVGQAGAGPVYALWLAESGALELTGVRQLEDRLEVVSRETIPEAGRPVAFVGSDVYWLADAFIRRGTIDGTARLGGLTSVVWSPVPVEAAALWNDATAVTTVAWYGRTQGGRVTTYASDDGTGFVPGLTDQVAKAMRWSPWTAWQEAVGQALTAVLAGVTVTLGLAPLLFVLGLAAVRLRLAGSRPALAGAVLGMVTPAVVLVVVAMRYPSPAFAAALTADNLVRALPWLLLGGVLGQVLARRRDNEAQLVTFIAACSTAMIAITSLAFVNYHAWATFIGII